MGRLLRFVQRALGRDDDDAALDMALGFDAAYDEWWNNEGWDRDNELYDAVIELCRQRDAAQRLADLGGQFPMPTPPWEDDDEIPW